MLQVFGYLHTAGTKIGFTHGDLNCANVMEHRGDADLCLPKGFEQGEDDNAKFKLPGMPTPKPYIAFKEQQHHRSMWLAAAIGMTAADACYATCSAVQCLLLLVRDGLCCCIACCVRLPKYPSQDRHFC